MKTLYSILVGLMAASGITPLIAATVTNLNDNGPGSLRAALQTGGDIDFAVTGTITLTSGELVVNQPTTIAGPGAEQLTIMRSGAEGTPAFRVFRVQGSQVTISGLTVRNGLVAGTDYNGAGILNEGSLTLNDCAVRGNRSTVTYARGTGLFNASNATLTANRCVFAENVGTGEYAEGSGIYVFGVVNLIDCTIRGNRGEGYYSRGGGMHVDYFGSAGVARCTFSSNSVTGLNAQGGGIYNYGRLEIFNSTLSGNHSGETGGGIHVDSLAPNTAIRNCTISGNTARTGGAGLSNYGFTPNSTPRTLKDSIIAGNSPSDIESHGGLASLGHNVFGEISGNAIAGTTGDHFGVTADALRLAPLANNGGPTQTRALLAGSPALDAGNPSAFPEVDQRGIARPFNSRPDIGAFELDVLLPPLVTVVATQPNTIEAGPTVFVAPGVFTISRSGITNESLRVFYRLSGTASNSVDYQFLSNSVVIPAGQKSAELRVNGRFDGLVEGTETVALHLEEFACPPIYPPAPECYLVGSPAEAVVEIQDYEQPTNRPPVVEIFAPANNQVFTAPANIFIAAQANDPDDYLTVQFVEFFAGTNSLGIRTNFPTLDSIGPFKLTWTNVPPGEYKLTARAVDDHGLSTVSETVKVNVRSPEPPTNQLPSVRILTPTNGQTFFASFECPPCTTNDPPCLAPCFLAGPAVTICADALDEDGYVDYVEFFAGTTKIGARTNCLPCDSIQNPFCIVWSDAPVGEHTLTAKVTDNQGATRVSEPVHISVRGEGSNQLGFRLAFNNPNANTGVFFRNYTVNGPAEGNRLLPADRVLAAGGDRYFYGAKPHVVWRVDRDTGAVLELDPGAGLPELSWPMGVAYDSHRTRVLLTSLGGDGYFYAYSPASNRWSLVRSQNNLDLDCLEYHPSLDALFGVRVLFGDGGPGAIYRFNPEGVLQSEIALPKFPFGIGPTGYRSELVSIGDYLVLLLEADLQLDPYGESRMYLIDPRNGHVQLTYRHLRPRPDLPPTVQINSPAAGQSFHAPADIQLVAYAQDAEDGYDLKVEFFAGTNSLGLGTFVPSLCPSPYCPNFALTWSNVPPGQYTLKAVATDSNGTATISAPVPITVLDAALSLVTLQATDASASEAGGGGAFTVSRAGNTNSALHVFYSISGTASNGVDYVALSNSVFLAEGAKAATIQITPINDALFEGTERVELRLLPPPFYLFPYVIGSPSNAVVNIADNDEQPKPVVTIEATDAQASEAPGNPGMFKIRRDGPTNQLLYVYLAISGTASNGVDYVRLTNIVVIATGKKVVELSVTPVDDNLFEGAESVSATLFYPPIAGPMPLPYVIGAPSNAVVNIADNDAGEFPVVTIEAPHATASETPGDPGLFHIYRTGPTNHSLTVFWEIGGTASNSVDYATLSNLVVIPAGRSFVRIAVVPVDDTLVEGPETVRVTLYHPPFAGPLPPAYVIGSPSNAVVTILDSDPSVPPPFEPAVVTIEATDQFARETGMLTIVEPGLFTIRRTGNTNPTLHVLCVIEGSASNGVDYIGLSNVVIIPSGVTSVQVPVYPLNDNLTEGTETVRLSLQSPICIAIYPPPPECYEVGAPGTATVFISDPDAPPGPVVTITARDSIASEGTNCFRWVGWSNPPPANYGGTNTATLVVRRHGPTNDALVVHYHVRGTASNGVDYAGLPGFVTIPAGRRAAEIIIVPVEDNLPERLETIVLELAWWPGGRDVPPSYVPGTPPRAAVVIVDNDHPRPVSGPLPDHGFHFTQPGTNGIWYRVETSTDLRQWTPLVTNVVTDGAIHFVDPDATDASARFYRAVLETNLPVE